MTSYEQWRNEADGMGVPVSRTRVGFRPAVTGRSAVVSGRGDASLPRDGFGLVCETEPLCPQDAGCSRLKPDGVRAVDGETVIDAWDGPTQQVFTHNFEIPEDLCIGFQWSGLKEPEWRISVTLTPQSSEPSTLNLGCPFFPVLATVRRLMSMPSSCSAFSMAASDNGRPVFSPNQSLNFFFTVS